MMTGTDEMVSDDEFRAGMEPFGPFEQAPHLAVGVSGGSDSMALARLAGAWCRARGGRLTALTVDHGLRTDSTKEAERVSQWAAAQIDVGHAVLPWNGPKPVSGVQAAARDARYRLMDRWCRDNDVLHLLLGHTADDQAETFLLRLRGASGPIGLAGMPAIRELQHCRILRPLLDLRRDALRRFLTRAGDDWIDDPGNIDDRFARTVVRRLIADGQFSTPSLCRSATEYGRIRVVAEKAVDYFLAGHVGLHSAGFAWMNIAGLRATDEDTVLRGLGRVIAAIGGTRYVPRSQGLSDLLDTFMRGGDFSRTLGRCRIYSDRDDVMICRETRNLPAAYPISPGCEMTWDNRIVITATGNAQEGLHVCTTDTKGWNDAARSGDDFVRWRGLARPIRESLPVLAGPTGVFSAPLLTYNLEARGAVGGEYPTGVRMAFRPLRPLSTAGFRVANWR